MGVCHSKIAYSAPCCRCAPGRIFSKIDATSLMEIKTEEMSFFARYRLRHTCPLKEREMLMRAGFKDIFLNDPTLPMYACDDCIGFSNIPMENWVYSKAGFLRLE